MTTITNLTTEIKIDLGTGENAFVFPKSDILIKRDDENNLIYIDCDGTIAVVNYTDVSPPISSNQELFELLQSYKNSKNLNTIKIFGRNPDVDNVLEDLIESGGEYVQPTTGVQMQIHSTQAADGVGNTGCQQIKLVYLDSNWEEKSEIITTNGTGIVTTVATDIFRVQYFFGIAFGTSNKAVGLITLELVTAGTPNYSFISAGFSHSRQAIYTVPIGKKLKITGYNAGAGSGVDLSFTEIFLKSTTTQEDDYLSNVFGIKGCLISNGKTVNIKYENPLEFPEKTDIKLSAISNLATSSAVVCGSFEGYLEDI